MRAETYLTKMPQRTSTRKPSPSDFLQNTSHDIITKSAAK
jgi:hypothetical protein